MDEEVSNGEHFNYRFDKKLSDAIVSAGYIGDENDISAKALFLTKRMDDMGVKIDGQTVRNWLRAERFPQNTGKTRRNGLCICFTLKMSLERSIDFMQNTMFIRAFNFRDPFECIAFYALNTGKDWSWVKQFDEEIRNLRSVSEHTSNLDSIEIANGIRQLTTDEELTSYLLNNVPENAVSLRRAKEAIHILTARALELAAEEAERYGGTEGLNSTKIAFLLRTIYGYRMRGSKIKTSMEKKALPLVVTNFPMEQEFSEMLSDDGVPSADMLRKALILLVFYNSFAQLTHKDTTSEEHYDRFVSETQMYLEECCLPLLHPRNPYDRIFLYCAYQPEETEAVIYLDEFRSLIETVVLLSKL